MKKYKKEKNVHQASKDRPASDTMGSGISDRGKKVILAGAFLLLIGYLVLTKTDPAGQNWASKLSPFLILGGYAAIGIGIITPGKKKEDSTTQ